MRARFRLGERAKIYFLAPGAQILKVWRSVESRPAASQHRHARWPAQSARVQRSRYREPPGQIVYEMRILMPCGD